MRLHGHKRKNVARTQEVEKSNTEEPMAMSRLPWIASGVGSATDFAKETIIPQKPSHDEDRSVGGTLHSLPTTLHAVILS